MRAPVVAALVALAIIVVLVGAELVRDFAATRERLTLDQRERAAVERDRLAAEAERNLYLDAAASSFDPIGLFH